MFEARAVMQSIPTPEQFLKFCQDAVALPDAEHQKRRANGGTLKLLEQVGIPPVLNAVAREKLIIEGYSIAVAELDKIGIFTEG
jgi:hypothetical protein